MATRHKGLSRLARSGSSPRNVGIRTRPSGAIANVAKLVAVALFVGWLAAGCTRAELEHKAEAYNAAISESSNELILLNAVRASQRAPMSFTSLGGVTASPNFSGTAAGTFSFDPVRLTGYSINPSASYSGGFQAFNMANLNEMEFINKIRYSTDDKLRKYFQDLNWPQELVALMFIASYHIRREELASILRRGREKCDTSFDPRTTAICDAIGEQQAQYNEANCHQYETPPAATLLNTARDLCGMAKFQIFLRTLRLLHIDAFDRRYVAYRLRSAHGMLYYLGELIAAQNYSTARYEPKTLIGTPEGRKLVPLFVVRRGAPGPGEAAVRVNYNGELFYIPQPALGTATEARSLQVLDLVSQVITAQTSSTKLPAVSTIGLLPIR